jgi:hypothetical protein
MPGMPQTDRLAELMDERRLDLGLRWADVASESGMSIEGLGAMRRTGAVPRALNQRGIEKALRWERGSVKQILRGDDPVPAAAPVPPLFSDGELDQLETELGVPLDRLDPDTRRTWLSLLNAAIRKMERDRDEHDHQQRRGA